MVQLDDMALFVAVVKAKSFRHAAEALGVANSTLSRRISALETEIGLRLLHRTTRKLLITEAGQLYFDQCLRIIEDAQTAHERLQDIRTEPSGLLRVSAPVDFAQTYLSAPVVEFCRAHPAITFELDLTPRNVDLVAEPFDVAVRMQRPPDSGLIARGLATLTPRLFASPGYLAAHGQPLGPEMLIHHQCISLPKTRSWRLLRGREMADMPIGGQVKANSPGMAKRLAELDLGLVLIPDGLVAREVSDGRLVPILPDWQGEAVPVYILTEGKLLPAKTRHFIDFLLRRLG